MRFLIRIFRQYPWQTAIMLALLLLSGIVEGFGLSAMLPLLAIALGNSQGGAIGAGQKSTEAERMVREVFEAIGLTPTLEILLLFIFILPLILIQSNSDSFRLKIGDKILTILPINLSSY